MYICIDIYICYDVYFYTIALYKQPHLSRWQLFEIELAIPAPVQGMELLLHCLWI